MYCFICGEENEEFFNNHHKIPKIEGGKELAILCDRCHYVIHHTPQSTISHKRLVKLGMSKKRQSVSEGRDIWRGRGKDKKPRKLRGSPK